MIIAIKPNDDTYNLTWLCGCLGLQATLKESVDSIAHLRIEQTNLRLITETQNSIVLLAHMLKSHK